MIGMSLSFGAARSWRYQNKQCSETQTVVRNDCMAIINRNTPYFNHTRSTVNKVSTNLVQTAKLSFIPKSMVDYLAKGQSETAGTCFIKPSGEDKA